MKGQTLALVAMALALSTAIAEEPKYTIENAVNTFDKERVKPTKVGYEYWFADKAFADGKTLKLSVVKPHSATHEPHTHAEDEFFFVLEGTAEFHLDGETATQYRGHGSQVPGHQEVPHRLAQSTAPDC